MKKLIVVALCCAVAGGVFAESKPIQLSLTPDIALQSRDTTIEGVSLGVWNENPGTQWQIGIVNGSTGESKGLQGPIIWTLFNYADNHTGVQWGLVNYADSIKGVQLGMVNWTEKATGLQWGLVNYAAAGDSLVQLGLVNIIEDNEWFSDFPSDLAKGFVFVNWSFGE